MANKTDIIFVSSEDDKYHVKGGIGTYLGIFTRVLARLYPEFNITWISQSPNNTEFEEREGNVHRIYLPKIDQNLNKYAQTVEGRVRKLTEEKLAEGENVIIESPEWEGLLANFYRTVQHKNLLKVTRMHTPLAVTAALNQMRIGPDELEQMDHEKEQILCADLISCPTQYVWEATISDVFSRKAIKVDRIEIPNCIDTTFFKPDLEDRKSSIDIFKRITGKEIEESCYNIFILGSLEKRKGSHLVAKMVEKVIQDIPNAHFYFIGHHDQENGEELTANQKLSCEVLRSSVSAAANKNIHFTGYIPHEELPHIMVAGDLFVVSYLGDNFPGVVAEIGLSKRPLLALLRGGVTEMLATAEGPAALTIDSSNDQEIICSGAAQIVSYCLDPSEGVLHAEKLYKKLIEEYDETKVVERLITSYCHALQRRKHERHPGI
jgi:glycosyltransferase involved in cell wall biosynthesis